MKKGTTKYKIRRWVCLGQSCNHKHWYCESNNQELQCFILFFSGMSFFDNLWSTHFLLFDWERLLGVIFSLRGVVVSWCFPLFVWTLWMICICCISDCQKCGYMVVSTNVGSLESSISNHFNRIFPEISHPAIGLPPFGGNPSIETGAKSQCLLQVITGHVRWRLELICPIHPGSWRKGWRNNGKCQKQVVYHYVMYVNLLYHC